ncbi:MAG: hypothetical protein AAFZ01_03180 [Pseudomonadota bacterium]
MKLIHDEFDDALPVGVAFGLGAVTQSSREPNYLDVPAAEQQRLVARGLERAHVERAAAFRTAAGFLTTRIGRGLRVLLEAKRDIPRLQAEARRQISQGSTPATC